MRISIGNLAVFSLALWSSNWAYALQVHHIDEYHPLKTTLSAHSFNRIVADKSGIKKLMAPEGLFAVEIDELTRQAFITILKPLEKPVAISIITDHGFVQDLLIEASNTPTETVVLKEPKEESQILDVSPNDHIPQVLSAIRESSTPYGYQESPLLSSDDRLASSKALKLIPVRCFEGAYDRIVVYRLINKGSIKVPVKEVLLEKKNDLWIHVESPFVDSGKDVQITIAKSRGRQ